MQHKRLKNALDKISKCSLVKTTERFNIWSFSYKNLCVDWREDLEYGDVSNSPNAYKKSWKDEYNPHADVWYGWFPNTIKELIEWITKEGA
jgi:hypothetical protein